MNAITPSRPARIEYNGVTIRERDGKLNLTDMWKAAGADPQKRPAKWRELDSTKAFVSHLSEIVLLDDNMLFTTTAGRMGETFAHWQIGLAYAKHLSPAFHAWGNQVIRDRMEGNIGRPEELASAVVPAMLTKGELGRMVAAIIDSKLEDSMAPMHASFAELVEKIDDLAANRVTDPSATPTKDFITVLAYLESKGWPAKGRRSLVYAVSARLTRHSERHGFPIRLTSEKGTRMFHVDAFASWEDSSGRAYLSAVRDQREGQAAFPFKPRREAAKK